MNSLTDAFRQIRQSPEPQRSCKSGARRAALAVPLYIGVVAALAWMMTRRLLHNYIEMDASGGQRASPFGIPS